MCAADHFHTPVLLQETIDFLLSVQNGIFVDGTLGGGGHARALAERLTAEGKIIALDVDDDAIATAMRELEEYKEKVHIVRSNFRNVKAVLSQVGIDAIDGFLLDLGVSSFQLDEPRKGFSFQADAPLDMRMDRNQAFSAWHVVNEYTEEKLADVIWNYGEEKYSRRIARALVEERKRRPLTTTGDVAEVVRRVAPRQFQQKTLARVFQAIRIEVNEELENIRRALDDAIHLLRPGGRLVVISYHSLEDRIVKETMKRAAKGYEETNPFEPRKEVQPLLKILTKKPITPTNEEIHRNPRARSAKLRAAEKI